KPKEHLAFSSHRHIPQLDIVYDGKNQSKPRNSLVSHGNRLRSVSLGRPVSASNQGQCGSGSSFMMVRSQSTLPLTAYSPWLGGSKTGRRPIDPARSVSFRITTTVTFTAALGARENKNDAAAANN